MGRTLGITVVLAAAMVFSLTASTASPQAGSAGSPHAGSAGSPHAGSAGSPRAASTGSPQAESAAVLLEKGIFNEETKGDLDAAVRIYRKIIGDAKANRKYVAEAYYRLGMCHLKKGDKETDKAIECFQKVVSLFPDQKQPATEARKQLSKISPAPQARLPLAVIAHIVDLHMEAYKQAQAKGLPVNTHIYGVDDEFNKYFGGFLTYKNMTGQALDEEIPLGNFSHSHAMELFGEQGAPQRFRFVKRTTTQLGKYRLWWKPDRPVHPGEIRLLAYLRKKTQKLPEIEGSYQLKMKNHFGSPVLENFFLVIPYNVTIAKHSRDYILRKRIGMFDVYQWQREVPANSTNAVNVILKKVAHAHGEFLPLNNVVERTVRDDGVGTDCLIDLDAGKLYSHPKDTPPLGKEAALEWLKARGIDAKAEARSGAPGLWGIEMVVIPISEKIWNNADTEEVIKALVSGLTSGKPGTPAVMSALGELPRTYAFKTREGSLGVLQILQVVHEAPRHVKIRYKLLKHGQPAQGGQGMSPAKARKVRMLMETSGGLMAGLKAGVLQAMEDNRADLALDLSRKLTATLKPLLDEVRGTEVEQNIKVVFDLLVMLEQALEKKDIEGARAILKSFAKIASTVGPTINAATAKALAPEIRDATDGKVRVHAKPTFRITIQDNSGVDLDSGNVMALEKQWPDAFDLAWDDDKGGILMRKPKSAVRILTLPDATDFRQAVQLARKRVPELRASEARGVPATACRYLSVLTNQGKLAVIQIGKFDRRQAVIEWSVTTIPGIRPSRSSRR